jgi:uncharacterized protein YciI
MMMARRTVRGSAGGVGVLGLAGEVEGGGFEISPEKHLFLVVLRDRRRDLTPDLLDQHLEHLRRLTESGHLDSAGAYASGERGLQILVASSRDDAATLVASDPLIRNGFYASFDLDEILKP